MLEEVRAAFDSRAATYDQNEWHLHCAERLVELAEIRMGQRVLDAACGTGFVALAAASKVGTSGHVVGVDISDGMLAQAGRKANHRNVTNVSFERHDVTSLSHLSAATFDVVLCAAGLLYLPVAKALAEWHRLLRPGGVVAFSAMAADEPRGASVFRSCAAMVGLQLTNPNAALGTEARCHDQLDQAGFRPTRVSTERVPFGLADRAMAWESNLKSHAHKEVSSLTPQRLDELRAAYENEMNRLWDESREALSSAAVIFAVGSRDNTT